jgi:hypothetical protein
MNTNKSQTEQLTQDAVMQSVLKASDCRYGNYIIYGGSITQLNEKEMCHFFRFPQTYKPIPFSEEWLIKFGFEWNDFDETYCKGRIRITKDFKTFVGLCLLPKKYFVHEIQNIFFSTENYELTVA